MSSTPAQRAGCFVATYPSTVWQTTQCVTAPKLPLLPYEGGSTRPSKVGNGNDEVAYSSSTLIGSSVGSFQVNGLTSETDSIYGANNYGLQVNSQFFTTSTTYTGSKSSTGWEQFVWINWPYSNSVGYEYIQYWLIGYQNSYGSCPSTGPPGGSSWAVYQGSCYANSPGAVTPLEAATNLASLSLEGFSNYNNAGNDVDMFCASGSCYDVTITDQIVNLYPNWHYSEFNVFGVGSGSGANFNSGTTITVTNTLKDQSGNVIMPSCVNTGFTGETNNLNLGSCSPYANGEIVFTEASSIQTLDTNVASGSGSVGPNCPGGCSEAVGQQVSVTATPSSGWQFVGWSISGASCSSGSSTIPCVFTMPNNVVTVSATFTQITTQTLTSTSTSTTTTTNTFPSLSLISGFTGNSSGNVLLVVGDISLNPHGSKPSGVGYQAGRDSTPLGFLAGMMNNAQPTLFDTNAAYVNSLGRPTVQVPLIFSIGGPLVNGVTHYYETTSNMTDQAPLNEGQAGGNYTWTYRNGTVILQVPQSSTSVPPGTSDVFTIQILRDANAREVVLIDGRTYLGTWAAAWYFKNVIYPNIGTYTNGYYLIRWTDATSGPSANGVPDAGDTFTVLATATS